MKVVTGLSEMILPSTFPQISYLKLKKITDEACRKSNIEEEKMTPEYY